MDKVGRREILSGGALVRSGEWAVGDNGQLFAVSRRCRHLGAPLEDGVVDPDGCLVCPWHGAKYDVTTGQMTLGPQGIFAKIPGFDAMVKTLTRVLPLRRRTVVERRGEVFLN